MVSERVTLKIMLLTERCKCAIAQQHFVIRSGQEPFGSLIMKQQPIPPNLPAVTDAQITGWA